MRQCLIFAQSEATRTSLDQWCRVLGCDECLASFVISHSRLNDNSIVQLYSSLVSQVSAAIGSSPGRTEVVALIDSVSAEKLTAISERATWENLIAMLILTFPEVTWLFGIVSTSLQTSAGNYSLPFAEHSLIGYALSTSRHPWFDPTGLREYIRTRSNEDLKRMTSEGRKPNTPFQLPQRRASAAVIEDEVDYAIMHGYTAYRFGFRTDAITTWTQMRDLFHVRSPITKSSDPTKLAATLSEQEKHKYSLILEDMRLQFADKSADAHLSRLEDRAVHCNRLADINDDSDFRFMITTGQEAASDQTLLSNASFLKKKLKGKGALLHKPVGGPFELWRTAKLSRLLPEGVAAGFVSPPAHIMDDLYDGHGAPGKLALVARLLIERARWLLNNGHSVSDYLLSALLANDACELLSGKTPTMSLEAIKIKHAAEVRAECSFVGAGFHFDLKDRFKEIKHFVRTTCRWYYPSVRRFAELDARATICNELVKIYSEAGQTEEQDACLAQFRWDNRRLELSRSLAEWSPTGFTLNCILIYAELLLVSLSRILLAFGLWIVAFCGITFIASRAFAPEQTGLREFPLLLATQLNWMIGGAANGISALGQSASDQDMMLALVSIGANIIGVFHFGILISYFYSLISRK